MNDKNHYSAQQYILQFPHDEKLTREAFIIGDCNQTAFDILQQWPDWPVPFLTLYGEAKSGKTHLMNIWSQDKAVRKICSVELLALGEDLPADSIIWLDINADDIKETSQENHLSPAWQEKLFHLYNRIILKQCLGLIITSTTPPSQWEISLPDLRSRLKGLPAVQMGTPNDALLAKLLRKLCDDRKIILSDKIINFLLLRMERSFAGCYDLCECLNHYNWTHQKNVTLAVARECLQEMQLADES